VLNGDWGGEMRSKALRCGRRIGKRARDGKVVSAVENLTLLHGEPGPSSCSTEHPLGKENAKKKRRGKRKGEKDVQTSE